MMKDRQFVDGAPTQQAMHSLRKRFGSPHLAKRAQVPPVNRGIRVLPPSDLAAAMWLARCTWDVYGYTSQVAAHNCLDRGEAQLEVGDDVLDRLDTDRQSDQTGVNTTCCLLGFVELAVGG